MRIAGDKVDVLLADAVLDLIMLTMQRFIGSTPSVRELKREQIFVPEMRLILLFDREVSCSSQTHKFAARLVSSPLSQILLSFKRPALCVLGVVTVEP